MKLQLTVLFLVVVAIVPGADVRSRGRGPIELRGQRNGPKSMKVTQRIYKVGRGHVTVRTNASLRPGERSPSHAVYPGCNQDPGIKRDRLGTSVGWSDIYPADYDKQYINVSGQRGCFAFTMTVDPKHHLFESNEHDNSSHRRVHLPFTGAGC